MTDKQSTRRTSFSVLLALVLLTGLLPASFGPALAQTSTVSFIAPDAGEILDGTHRLQANVDAPGIDGVEFLYRAHDDTTATSLGAATLDASTGFWIFDWDTTTVADTHQEIGGVDTFLTKPPTQDTLRVVATTGDGELSEAIDVRIQNMLTTRFTLPDNQEDLRGFQDLEALVTGEFEATSVRFDVYDVADADQRIFIPFGEASEQGEPIENPHYGRPLGDPDFPTGGPLHEIGAATPEGSKRWVFRGWDTTTIDDGTYLLVATAEDAEGRRATYMVETYIVNDLRVVITAPSDGDTVSRFVALEARTGSMTGADNAAPGSLWRATSVTFNVGGTDIPATENPSGSGRWRAVWDGDSFAAGDYTITATATNENPNGAETAVDEINVTLVEPGNELEAFFPFDWSNCTLRECAFLDGSSGGPTSWEWDFGDGNTSTDQLPVHTYETYGVYEVSLTVDDDDPETEPSTYSRVIPVGNVGAVGFNINPINDEATEFIDWTSAFKDFDYTVGDTLAVPVMWKSTTGATEFVSVPEIVCNDGPDSPEDDPAPAPCVLFTPEESDGNPPRVVDPPGIGPVVDGVLFEMEFTEVQVRGVTDAFKGKVNLRVRVNVDSGDGNPDLDWEAQLGTNVDVTNTGVEGDEARVVAITSPFEGQFVGGMVPITATTVSSVAADQVEFFVNGTSIHVDDNGSNGWTASWDTTTVDYPDGPYALTAVASIAGTDTTSAARNVTVENTIPEEPPAPDGTFQIGRANDTTGKYLTYPHEIAEDEEGGGPGGGAPAPGELLIPEAAMEASFSDLQVLPGEGVIGGDVLEFDATITNTAPLGSGIVLSAFAFQSKFSESPALGSRIGDKAFYGQTVPGSLETTADSALGTVKKNGTSQGLFTGKWKGICINSSEDFIPEFNSGLEDESLECAGNRADTDLDGDPELQTGANMLGLRPQETQVIRLRLDSGTTDGALHVVEPGTLRGRVVAEEINEPGRPTYLLPSIDNTGVDDPNVLSMPDFGDNKVLRDADGTFNPTFAPAADDYTFENQTYLTLPRRSLAFTDIIGRNHSCATYGLTLGACSGGGSPEINFMDTGDLVPGVQNFAAILRGFGEFYDPNGDFVPDENPDFEGTGEVRPNFPYNVLCENCGGTPYVPIAEFFVDGGGGSLTQSLVAGSYGDPVANPYLATIDASTATEVKEEIIPEPDPGGPCDPLEDPESKRPSCAQLRTSATGQFHDLTVVEGAGINGGDAVEFTMDITNTSRNPEAYLTAFNYQTKRRGLADIGILDGYTQDRRDVRVDSSLPPCTSAEHEACWNAGLGTGHFPNAIGNGLLFGQMVWTNDDAGREGPVVADQVHVDPANGIDPEPFRLESVKKNGPFSPILKGNTNFICVKSGLFDNDPDADAGCAGEPAILTDPDGQLVPGNIDRRLGLPSGETQQVRMRMEWGDFRGAMLEVAAGTLTADNVDPRYGPAGTNTNGLARFFDCSDQRELEFCHPHLVGQNIGYLPNTDANWLTPETLEEIKHVIINQPGDAPRVMNFEDNLGYIMAMAGFQPSAEFYAPDPNPDLIGTPDQGILIRQQVLGSYAMMQTDFPNAVLGVECSALSCNFDSAGSTTSPGTIESYAWDFGDGATSDEPAPGHSYDDPGTYEVELTVASGGFSASATTTVEIADDVSAAFTFDCSGLECNFTDASTGSVTDRSWDFGDGSTSSLANPTHTYDQPGVYDVTLTVDGAANSSTATATVPVANALQDTRKSTKIKKQTIRWDHKHHIDNYVAKRRIATLVTWDATCGATGFNTKPRVKGITVNAKKSSPKKKVSTPNVLGSGDSWVLFDFQFNALTAKNTAKGIFGVYLGTDKNCDGTIDGDKAVEVIVEANQ